MTVNTPREPLVSLVIISITSWVKHIVKFVQPCGREKSPSSRPIHRPELWHHFEMFSKLITQPFIKSLQPLAHRSARRQNGFQKKIFLMNRSIKTVASLIPWLPDLTVKYTAVLLLQYYYKAGDLLLNIPRYWCFIKPYSLPYRIPRIIISTRSKPFKCSFMITLGAFKNLWLIGFA